MNEEIAEGIKFAMSKGETLQQAMQSFYNAGYPRQEVEEAARSLQQQLHIESEKGIHAVHPEFGTVRQTQQDDSLDLDSKTPVVQKVSSYESEGKGENPRRKMIILVSVLLLILALIFAGIFFFRGYLLQLFGKLLG